MTSKERVRSAIEHRLADRVALDYMARGEVTAALKSHFGVVDDAALHEALGIDTWGVAPKFVGGEVTSMCYADPTIRVDADGTHRDIWGVGFAVNQTTNGMYMDLSDSPLTTVVDAKDLDAHRWPTATMWDYSTLADDCAKHADKWLWGHSRGIFEISWFLRGFENFLLDLVAEPELADAVMDRVQAYLMDRTRCMLDAARGQLDMIEYNDDVGSQKGMLMSPAVWRERLKPRMRQFIDLCKGYGVRIRYHSCGSIRPIIGDLIDIGVDVLNPVQTAAVDMDLVELKREFGKHITFNGGIDTEHLLPTGTADEVRASVSQMLKDVAYDGGYLLAPSHVFQPDVPLKNVLAVYEAALGRRL